MNETAGAPGVLAFLMGRGADPGRVTPDKETLLHLAARMSGNPASLRYLVARGAALEARDADGWTPLHGAAFASNAEAVAALAALGANLEARDQAGKTPLLLAVDAGQGPDGAHNLWSLAPA